MKNFYNNENLLFFKSKILQIILFFLTLTSVAQVTIPAANTNTASNRKPFGSFFGFERTAAIYTAAELGIPTGSTINSLCYYVNAVTTPSDAPVTIFMASTTETVFTASTYASEITGATQVYAGTVTGSSLVVGTWQCITLSTPFIYTGGNLKLMVQTDAGGAGSELSTAKQFRWSSGASQTWQADTTAPIGTGTVSATSRPNIQINYSSSGTSLVQFSTATYSGNEGESVTVIVSRIGLNTNAISVDYATSNGTALTLDYTPISGTINWAALDTAPKTFIVALTPDILTETTENVVLTLSNPVGTSITGTNPSNLTINNVLPPMIGAYTVGTGGDFSSLTNAGGLFESINLTGSTAGPVTINIISDLTAETGTFALNEFTGGFPLVIKPSGVARTITGSNTGTLIKLNGTENVTINGSITGASLGTACVLGGDPALRLLTIININTATTATILAIQTGTNGAQNNTIKNLNIQGIDPITSLLGIAIGGNTAGIAGADNDFNVIENCAVKKVVFGIYAAGISAANPNTGTIITKNDLSATGVDRVRRVGIFIFNDNGIQITQNNIGGIDTSDNNDAIGIALGTQNVAISNTTSGGISNALVANNKIDGVAVTGISDYSAAGIAIAGIPGSPNRIENNMISGISSGATNPDIVAGIFVMGTGGTNTQLYYNTIALSGDRGTIAGQMPSYGIAITSVNSLEEMKNNIVTNSQTSSGGGANAKSYAVGLESPVFTNFNFDYNDYFTSGANAAGMRSGSLAVALGTDYATVPLWAAAIADDAHSVAIAPVFVSATDLHITAASNPTLLNLGTAITTTNDLDCETRGATPDMGADEINTLALAAFEKSSIIVYPNPTSGLVRITSENELNLIQVFNVLGQQLITKSSSGTSIELDLNELENGNYFIKVTSQNRSVTSQIIKK